jgi:hypothetical protein
MATVAEPEGQTRFRSVPEFAEANRVWPRGDRPEAIREAASAFRERFTAGGEVVAVKTVPLVAAPYPLRFAFGRAAWGLNPFIIIVNRLVVVQFFDFDGVLRTLVWEPTVPEGSAEAPFYDQLAQRFRWLPTGLFNREYHTVGHALSQCGLSPADVDYVTFDHLHVQDLRRLMGRTTVAGGGEAFFPNAWWPFQRAEVDTLRSTHPMQWAWYVPGGLEGVRTEGMVELDGDVELGVGVALLHTPGHTDGNQSLCINTAKGVWVSSENGVAVDNWVPGASAIPGVRRYTRFFGHEVVLNANTLEDSIDQYDSMVKEKAVADAHPADARWPCVMPSSELSSWAQHWPVHPSFTVGGVESGRLLASAELATDAGLPAAASG